MPKRASLLSILAASILAFSTPAAAGTESEELLAQSIGYHDPDGQWGREALQLSFDESRPDGSMRRTRVTLAPQQERFLWWSQRGERLLEGSLVAGGCSVALDGSTEISDEERETHRLDCDRVRLYRDYYTYLWGLPMKLRDPGTRLDPEVEETEYFGRAARSIRVTYDPEVGEDIWYFYFDPETSALIGYRFYHDEAANDGEYILLAGELSGGGLTLPKARTWYTHGDDRLLGTDTLTGLEPLGE